MGIFKKRQEPALRTIVMERFGGDVSLFAQSYAARIYDIPEVRAAIEAFADIFASIPKYVERVNKSGNIEYFEDQTSRVLTLQANPLQNSTQYWKNLITQLYLDNNVFSEPVFDESANLKALYVLPRDTFDFKILGDRASVTFGSTGKTYDMAKLIYLNRFATITGGATNNLTLYEKVVRSLAQQAINVASPNKPRAFLQGKTGAASEKLKAQHRDGTMADLKINMDKNVNGVSYLDGQWTVTAINWQENDVNRELMQFVISIVYNYFGMTAEIINNKATEIEFQLFVRNKMVPLAMQVMQEFTSKLFSRREIEFGNRIELDTFNLTIGTLSAKAALFNVGLRQGVIKIDDAREMIGLAPLSDGLGQMIRVTSDTMDITLANEMQKAQKGVKENDTDKGKKADSERD